jgi:hypothetical protein
VLSAPLALVAAQELIKVELLVAALLAVGHCVSVGPWAALKMTRLPVLLVVH